MGTEIFLSDKDIDKLTRIMEGCVKRTQVTIKSLEKAMKVSSPMQNRVAALRRIDKATEIIDSELGFLPKNYNPQIGAELHYIEVLREIRKALWEAI